MYAFRERLARASEKIAQRWHVLKPNRAAAVAILLGLTVTLAGWQWMRVQERKDEYAQLQNSTERIQSAIQQRLDNYQLILRGAAAYRQASLAMNDADWRRYTDGLKLSQTQPELVALEFSATAADTLVASDPRYAAWIKARDSGQPSMSAPLAPNALPEAGKGLLVAIYLPVYRHDLELQSIEQRRTALQGSMVALVRLDVLLNRLLVRAYPDASVQLYSGVLPDPQRQVYGTRKASSKELMATRQLSWGGRQWTMVVYSRAHGSFDGRSWQWLLFGLCVSVALTLLLNHQAIIRARADTVTRMMSRRLLRSQTELRAVLDAAPEGVLNLDSDGCVVSANQAAEHIFGVASGKLFGVKLEVRVPGFDRAQLDTLCSSVISTEGQMPMIRAEATGMRACGARFPLALSLRRFELDGEVHYSLMLRDVSDEKMAEVMMQQSLRDLAAARETPAVTV
ncbi:CHASE domain-containing protein [Pseudoduganella danionis]|uniref:CHASE domain-containing protein n=1 Tax=Pseudoduganella danionis TaxID=1890295 RepID=UPI0035B2B26B